MKTVKNDLTVVGAGYAGICVAIAAARHGLKVALVNDRDVLGGNASSEHRIHVNGAAGSGENKSFYNREAGIADELKMFTFSKNPTYNKKQAFNLSDMALLEKVLSEENISLFLGTVVFDCECENGEVKRVFAVKSKTEEQFTFESELFCDASGDGVLAYKAGCEYRHGRESCDEFGESLAPKQADGAAMPSCILFNVAHTGKSIKYTKPSFAYDLIKDDKLKYFNKPETGRRLPKQSESYNGLWWLEYAYPLNTIDDADDFDFELKKLVYGYWDYIKNSGLYPDADDMIIDWIAPYASKRESRRFIGEYILKQSDIQNSVDFDDAVSTGGWSLDIHDTYGIYGDGPTSAFGEVEALYNIPFSIMYSKDRANLLLAGRIASCTHVAMGSTRVMQTLGAMGQAVGTAAALCKKYNCLPTDVRNKYIKELQENLQKDGQFILGKKEDCGFVADAKITASSTKKLENLNADEEFTLKDTLIFTLPISKSFTNKMDVKIKNTSGKATALKYKIFNEKNEKVNLSGELLFEGEVPVCADFDNFISLPIELDGNYRRIFVEIENNEALSVFGSTERVIGAPSYFIGMWKAKVENAYSYCFKGVEQNVDLYSPQNIANGYSRPTTTPNCWVSEGKENQWLELSFDKAVDISQIQIYFNPQFETDHFNEPIRQLITDYDIIITSTDGEIKKEIRGNYNGQNFIDITAKGVSKIHFDFIANNGAPEFEVFAIKIF